MKVIQYFTVLILCLLFTSCSTSTNNLELNSKNFLSDDAEASQSSKDDDTIESFFEEENMGYDLTISYRLGRTSTAYMLFDFDREVVTEMHVHYGFDGEYKRTDNISTRSIGGNMDSGWYTSPESDHHIYYDYSIKEDGTGIITQYNYQKQPTDTYREISTEHAVEFLEDGLAKKGTSGIILALNP